LKIYDLTKAIQEVERVRAGKAWICVESFRNERERANLMYWQLTCESFYSVDEWQWLYKTNGYQGDYEFIFFE
jgi:protein-L-isoaspartate(D-aspartate) O-methyltransferase